MGDLQVTYGPIRGGVIEGETAAALIDEIPVLAVLGALSETGLTVRDAAELRVKETDRIATVRRKHAPHGRASRGNAGRNDHSRADSSSAARASILSAITGSPWRSPSPRSPRTAKRSSRMPKPLQSRFPEFYELLEKAAA